MDVFENIRLFIIRGRTFVILNQNSYYYAYFDFCFIFYKNADFTIPIFPKKYFTVANGRVTEAIADLSSFYINKTLYLY